MRGLPFEPADKVGRLSQKCKHFFEEMQATASHSLRSHVCEPKSIFADVHAAGKNDLNFICACGRKLCEAFLHLPV